MHPWPQTTPKLGGSADSLPLHCRLPWQHGRDPGGVFAHSCFSRLSLAEFDSEVDYVDYGMKLLKAGTSLDGMEPADVLFNDYKIYTINDKSFSIGQFFTMNFQDIEEDINKYIETLSQTAEANHYEMVCLYVTDIIKNGSYVLFNEKAKNYIEVLYGIENPKEGLFIEGCISRKKNIVPLVMNIFDN